MFAPMWSAQRHPIYQFIEVADEEQLMCLHPEIKKLIEENSVVSCSGFLHQHQGLDAILEEVNKSLNCRSVHESEHFIKQILGRSSYKNLRMCKNHQRGLTQIQYVTSKKNHVKDRKRLMVFKKPKITIIQQDLKKLYYRGTRDLMG